MKKKLSVLLMGAFLAAAPIVSQAQLSGVGSTFAIGTVFTYNGQEFTIVNPPDPNWFKENDQERELEEAALEALRSEGKEFVYEGTSWTIDDLLALGANAPFAVSKTPFDLGLGVVLGAGAFAAAKRARNRRRLQKAIV